MKLYVSGPMTGIPEYNYPAFHAAKARLESLGHDVISPADLPVTDGWEWIDYILTDLGSVFQVDGVATLDGWERSNGARIECRVAIEREIPVKPLEDWISS